MTLYKALRFLERRSTVPLTGACLYEAFALTFPNKHTPPITVLCKRHRWALPAFCAGLAVHVWRYEVTPGV